MMNFDTIVVGWRVHWWWCCGIWAPGDASLGTSRDILYYGECQAVNPPPLYIEALVANTESLEGFVAWITSTS